MYDFISSVKHKRRYFDMSKCIFLYIGSQWTPALWLSSFIWVNDSLISLFFVNYCIFLNDHETLKKICILYWSSNSNLYQNNLVQFLDMCNLVDQFIFVVVFNYLVCRYSVGWRKDPENHFDIDPVEGTLFVSEALDRERNTEHNVTVVATKVSKYGGLLYPDAQPTFII